MDNGQFKNLLVFLILMGGTSVVSKSPDYIMEKFGRVVVPSGLKPVHPDDYVAGSLDSGNKAIYDAYLQKWGIEA